MGVVPPPPGASGSGKKGSVVPKPPGITLPPAGVVPKPPKPAPPGAGAKAKGRAVVKKFAAGGGGGIGDQIVGVVSSLPSGIVGLAKSAGEELAVRPAEGLYHGVTHGDVGEALYNLPFAAPVRVPVGLVQGAITGREDPDSPLSSGFGSSFRRSYEDVIHPSRFVDAYNHHQIVGKVLEDVGNAALVGGLAAKVLDVSAKGALEQAATARNTAEAAERAVPAAEKAAADAAKQAAEHRAAADAVREKFDGLQGPKTYRAIWSTRLDKTDALARDAAAYADQLAQRVHEARDFASASTAKADTLAGEHGVRFAAYRVARAVEHLGGQGAAAPAKPFELATKGLSKTVRAFLASNPRLTSALGSFDDALGVSEAFRNKTSRKALSAKVAQGEAVEAQASVPLGQAVDKADAILSKDPLEWQVAQAVRAGVPQAVLDQVEGLGRGAPGALEAALSRLDATARMNGWDPKAIRLAVDVVQGKADPGLAHRVELANNVLHTEATPIFEAQYRDENQGLQRSPSEAQTAFADFNLRGRDLPPGVRERVAESAVARNEKLVGIAQPQAKRVGRLAGKLGVTPETPVEAVQRTLKDRAAAQATPFGNLGRLQAVETAARNEGRAIVSAQAAQRFEAIRARIPPEVGDGVVHQIVAAVDGYKNALHTLDVFTGEQATRGEFGVEVAPQILGHVKELRAQARNLADAELRAFSTDLPSQLPFIPSDLAPDLYAPLYDRIADGVGGGRAASDRATVLDKMEQARARERGRAAYTRTDLDRLEAAYKKAYDSLPPAVKNAFAPLERSELAALWESHRSGGLPPEVGGLDVHAQEFALNRQGLDDPAGHAAMNQMLDEYAQRARVEAAVAKMKSNRWGPDTLALLGTGSTPELSALLDDPTSQAAIGSQRMADAAHLIAESHAQRAAAPVPMPGAQDLLFALDDGGSTESAFQRALGGDINDETSPAAMFFDRWMQAGEPDLDAAARDIIAGRTPEWASAEQPARTATGPSVDLGATKQQASARGELASLVERSGGQRLDPVLKGEADLLTARAATATERAAKLPAARQELVSNISGKVSKAALKEGRLVEKYGAALADLEKTRAKIADTPNWMQNELEGFYKKLTNAPARARPAIKFARDFTNQLVGFQKELSDALEKGEAAYPPEVTGVLEDVIRLGIRDVRDIWGAKVDVGAAGGAGRLAEAPAKFEPEYTPGGQPLRGKDVTVGPRPKRAMRAMRAQLAHEEQLKAAQLLPRSADEMRLVLRDRAKTHVANRAARIVAQTYGRRADGVLSPAELVDGEGKPLAPVEVASNMAAHGYIPWDNEKLFQRTKPSETGPHTLWLPEPIMKSVESYYGEVGTLERQLRRYYDKPTSMWKTAVLALRPAWHVNNISGNAFMAMIGSGMGPVEYGRRFMQAKALLELPEARIAEQLPEGMAREATLNRAQRRAATPGRLEKLRSRVSSIEPETLQALGGLDKSVADARIVGGSQGARLGTDYSLDEILGTPGLAKRVINRSYALNGAFDDASRLAVFLDQHAKLTDADLSRIQSANPELAGLTRDQIRTEGAVRISLKVAGDFMRMTPVERGLFRRVVPFYAWLRHITGLSLHLALHHPVRVAWTLHLAEMFGTPAEYGLASAAALSPTSILQMPSLSPFGDVTSLNPSEAGFNVGPIPKLALGAGLGIDLNRVGTHPGFQRPPGQPGGYGGPPENPNLLTRPRELVNLFANQFPQTRVARAVSDTVTEGKPVLRYPLGQIRRANVTSGHGRLESGEPVYGPLARYFGVPYVRQPTVYEKGDLARIAKGPVRAKGRG